MTVDHPVNGIANEAFDVTEVELRQRVPDVVTKAVIEEKIQLKKEVGLFSGVSLIVGTMIGSGIFVTPGGVLAGTGSVAMSLILWGATGFAVCLAAISYVELGTMIPISGGEYPYIFQGIHPVVAFLYNWLSMFVLKPSQVAIICKAFAAYVTRPFFTPGQEDELITTAEILMTIVAISLICFINCWSVRLATRVQNFFAAAKLGAIGLIILGGIVRICLGHYHDLARGFEPVEGTTFTTGSVALAFYNALWAFDGWNQLNLVTEEISNPKKDLPRAILIGIPLVTFLYVSVNIAYLTAMTPLELSESDAVAVLWANRVLSQIPTIGRILPWIIPISVAMSTFGAANGTLFTSGRITFVAGREGHAVKFMSFVHSERLTPAPSLIFCTLLSIVFTVLANIDELIELFSFTAWIFYGSAFLSLILLRIRQPQRERPFKVWIIIPIFVFLLSVFLVIAPIIDKPKWGYLYVVLFMFSGLIFYFPFVVYKMKVPWMEGITVGFQKLLNVVPTE